MSYITKNLLANETLVYHTRLHWIIFFMPIVLSILAGVFFHIGDLLILLGFLCLLIAAGLWISALVTYITSEFGVTNKRVIIKRGFIQRQTWETFLQKIASIEVEQSILGRLLGFGTMIVQNTGGGKDRFRQINNPLLLRRKVQEQIEANDNNVTMQTDTPVIVRQRLDE